MHLMSMANRLENVTISTFWPGQVFCHQPPVLKIIDPTPPVVYFRPVFCPQNVMNLEQNF